MARLLGETIGCLSDEAAKKEQRIPNGSPSIAVWTSLSLFIAVSVTGCKTVESAGPRLDPIQIKEQHKVVAESNAIRLPAGIYKPDFTTKHGAYYRAPGPLNTSGIGMDTIERGGIYLPNPSDPDKRQGVWLDRQGGSGGFEVQSSTKVFRFEEQIRFEVVSPSAGGMVK